MRPWTEVGPSEPDAPGDGAAFAAALRARDARRIGARRVWRFLRFLTAEGFVLHGTPLTGLRVLKAARKDYGQPDAFSNTVGVYAAADPIWPIMYAVRGPRAEGQMDMCLQLAQGTGWSPPRYFHALGTSDADLADPRPLMGPGEVLVLRREGFVPSPPYDHGGLGRVREAHLVAPGPVVPVMRVPVRPEDVPIPTRVYDLEAARRAALDDPWGFPWPETMRPAREGQRHTSD